jgi:arylsulfatase A-like enzyme
VRGCAYDRRPVASDATSIDGKPGMNVPTTATEPSTQSTAPATSPPTPGDRLLVGLWAAVALVVMRALLQTAVDRSAGRETGVPLVEHLVDHVYYASFRAWVVVGLVAILPRGARTGAWLRGLAVGAVSLAILVGLPDGLPRYRPGFDSARGLEGWGGVVAASLAIVLFDRFATSPRHFFQRLAVSTRIMLTAAILVVGAAGVAIAFQQLDLRRVNMEVETVVVDLLDELPRARATPGIGGALPEAASILADKGESAAGGNKPTLVVPVGSSVEYEADVPRHGAVSFSLGVDRSTIRPKIAPHQVLTFAVAVDGKEVFSQTLEPQQKAADRCWLERRVALTFKEERHARIALSLRADGVDLATVRAGFGRPLVVCREWLRRSPSTKERMNLVLVVVDSLRPDHLGCYGYARNGRDGRPCATSPAIDRLAQRGVVYDRVQAPSSWTWSSIASLFTGHYPPTHGVVDVDRCFLSDSFTTLAEVLEQNHVTTLGATANSLVTRTKNFQQGFGEWCEFPFAEGQRLAEQFEEWTRHYRDYQFFAFVHLVDPHRPFNPPEEYSEKFASPQDAAAMRSAVNTLRLAQSHDSQRAPAPGAADEQALPQLSDAAIVDLYDGEVLCVDAQIGRMVEALERAKLADRTIFVVTSSTGEVLGAGPPPPLGSSLSRDFLRVPLIVADPREPARRVADETDLTFLPATLLARLGVPATSAGPPPVVLPTWGRSAYSFAFAYTARGEKEDGTRRDLLELESTQCRLTTTTDGQVVEFLDERPRRRPDVDAVKRAELADTLRRWYELVRANGTSRRFAQMDQATERALEDFLTEPPKR